MPRLLQDDARYYSITSAANTSGSAPGRLPSVGRERPRMRHAVDIPLLRVRDSTASICAGAAADASDARHEGLAAAMWFSGGRRLRPRVQAAAWLPLDFAD